MMEKGGVRRLLTLSTGFLLGLGALSEGRADESVNLTIWMTDSRTHYKTWLDRAAEQYSEMNPGVRIDVVQMAPSDAYMRWPASIAAGNNPDISWMFYAFSAWLHDLPDGGFVPMDDLVTDLGAERFDEIGLAAWEYQGQYIGIPYTKQPFYLFYRQDMFNEAGIDAPETWQDVIAAAEALHDPSTGRFGIALAGRNDWSLRQNFEVVLYSNGGHLLSEDGQPIFDSPEAREALEIYRTLFGMTPPGSLSSGYTEVNRTFAQGAAAMAISLPVVLSQSLEARPGEASTIGAVIPSDRGLAITMQNNKGWSVFDNSPNIEIAMDFVRFLYEPNQYAGALEAAGYGWMPLYQNDDAVEAFLSGEGRDVGDAFPDAVETIFTPVAGYYAGIDQYGQSPMAGEVGSRGVLERNLNAFLAGEIDVEETVRRIQGELEEIFDAS